MLHRVARGAARREWSIGVEAFIGVGEWLGVSTTGAGGRGRGRIAQLRLASQRPRGSVQWRGGAASVRPGHGFINSGLLRPAAARSSHGAGAAQVQLASDECTAGLSFGDQLISSPYYAQGLHAPLSQPPVETVASSGNQREAFLSLYPRIAEDVLDDVRQLGLPERHVEWIARVFEFSIWGGKMTRGLMVPLMVETIMGAGGGSDSQQSQMLHQARVLGWAIEILQAAFLVIDDVCDQADTRRGKPAYYRLSDVGPHRAVNDGLLLESVVFRLMRRHLRQQPVYTDVCDLFRESIFITECGQLMDLAAPPDCVEDIDERFTLEQYRKMVDCKTSHYTFYLPMASSLMLTGTASAQALAEARALCDAIGEYFQVQDDYLGCFGDEATTGKGQNDVSERKCTWFAVTALQRCEGDPGRRLELQRALVAADTGRVTELYEQLGMRDAYSNYEVQAYDDIRAQLATSPALASVAPVLEAILQKMRGRSR
jgi:farnesyl diphosphate synthase